MKQMDQNVFIPHMVTKHFKGGLYCTMYASQPVTQEKIMSFKSYETDVIIATDSEFDIVVNKVTATSTLEEQGFITLYATEEGVFHDEEYHNHELAIYTSLYDGVVYARPMNMFLSVVDKEKYPGATQYFRMHYLSSCMTGIRTNTIFDVANNKVSAFFGDGKLKVGHGYQDTCDGRLALLAVLEQEEAREVGDSVRSSTKRDYEPDIVFAFKNKESIDVLIDTLNKCKLVLDSAN